MAKENEDFNSLCTAIGFIVINWALAEQSLDLLVETIHRECAGKDIERNLPRAFSHKVRFLRKMFDKSVALQTFAEEGMKLLDRMESLAETRHDLVHGVVVSIETVNGKFPIDKLDYGTQEHAIRRIEFDPATYDDLTNKLVVLGKDLTMLGTSLGKRFQSL